MTNHYSSSGTGKRGKTLSFKADLITDQNDIYDYYIAFAHRPEFFVATKSPPPCETHIIQKCGKIYYWVPKEAGPAFFELCMRTTFQRGKEELVSVSSAYERQIVSVDTLDTQTTLVQTLLRRIADLWPGADLTVAIEEDEIVG